jgi:hypothetical protein
LRPETGIVIFTMHNFFFLGANIIGIFTSYNLERYTRRDFLQKHAIQTQRDQSDKLLYNVLPERIAEKLKRSSDTIAEEFSSASVLFADIVNFTPISARFGPLEVWICSTIIFQFDGLVDKHSVEKIRWLVMVIWWQPGFQWREKSCCAVRSGTEMLGVKNRILEAGMPLRSYRVELWSAIAGGIGRKNLFAKGRHGQHSQPHGKPRRQR